MQNHKCNEAVCILMGCALSCDYARARQFALKEAISYFSFYFLFARTEQFASKEAKQKCENEEDKNTIAIARRKNANKKRNIQQ